MLNDESKLEYIACNLCGAKNETLLFVKAAPAGEKFSIVKCKNCGLVYVNPRLKEEEIHKLYNKPEYFGNFEKIISGYTNYIRDKELHLIFFRRQISLLEKYVRLLQKPKLKMLDVGCAVGFLLEEAKKRGWDVAGIEVSKYAAKYAKEVLKLPVFTGTIFKAKFPSKSFDAVVMNDVLEHMGDPFSAIKEVFRILKDNGLFLIYTPNEKSILRFLLGKAWLHFKPGEHLYYFSALTLSSLLRKAGFEVLHINATAKTTNLKYIIWRLKYYSKPLAYFLDNTLGKMKFLEKPFALKSGELEMLARKGGSSELAS